MSAIDKFADPEWRVESLYKIVTKGGKKVLFQPNSVQRAVSQLKSKRKIILKARQMGISTYELIRMLDFVLWNRNVNACILAHEQGAIEKLFRIVRRAYEFMDSELKPSLDRGGGSKYEMYFPSINSRIFCDLENRGSTIQWLHISEAAFIEDPMRVKATLESVPIDGIVTFESTPNGLNHFYDSWMDGESNYENVFFPWYFHDEYTIDISELTPKDYTDDERKLIAYAKTKYGINITSGQIAFRRFKQRELKQMFKQEYPEDDITCFLTSGNAPFNLEIIKPMYDNAPKPIEVIDGIRIYEKPKREEIYVIGADPAEGVEGDASAAHVFKVSNREQVASFHSKSMKPSEFADQLVRLADIYSSGYPPVLMGVERNNHGHAVLLKLDEIHEYANIFRTKKENKKTELEEIKLGWPTDRITRPLMIDTFIEGVENGTIILNDRETLGECLTLINNDGKIEAEEGKHDDLVMAACIAIQMSIEEGKLSIYDGIANKIKI
jgi:hypothetical protein